jgi:GT2 family glycosyltransferase
LGAPLVTSLDLVVAVSAHALEPRARRQAVVLTEVALAARGGGQAVAVVIDGAELPAGAVDDLRDAGVEVVPAGHAAPAPLRLAHAVWTVASARHARVVVVPAPGAAAAFLSWTRPPITVDGPVVLALPGGTDAGDDPLSAVASAVATRAIDGEIDAVPVASNRSAGGRRRPVNGIVVAGPGPVDERLDAVAALGATLLRGLTVTVLADGQVDGDELRRPRRAMSAIARRVDAPSTADPVGVCGSDDALVLVDAGVDECATAMLRGRRRGVPVLAASASALPAALGDVLRRRVADVPDPDDEVVRAALRTGIGGSARRAAVAGARSSSTVPVAVVIAHHRHADLLAHTLASVTAQDHPDLDVVVVDDGTPEGPELDRLHEVLARPWPRPVRLVRQENRYLGAARNTGVRSTSAPYIAFVDDDDVVDPAYVSTLLGAALATGAAAVTCAMATVPDDDGGPLEGEPTGVVAFLGGDAVALGPIVNVFGGAAGLVRRDAFDAVGGCHEEFGRGHEDWALYARLALAGHRVVSVPEPLYRYRIRSGSMIRSTSVWENMQPVFDAYRDQLPEPLREWPELLRRLGDDVAERDRALEEARAELVAADAREHALRAEIEALRAHRDAMQASTTWRVGRVALSPLGAVRRVARRTLR